MLADARYYYRDGVCEAVIGNYDTAEYFLLKSLEIDPAVSTYATLGWLYGSILERGEDALRSFRHAIRMDSDNGDLYNDIGALLIKMDRVNDSVKWFRRALRCSRCNRRHFALYNLALVYREWNRSERSRRYLNLALRMMPDFEQATNLLRELEIRTQAPSSFGNL